MDNDENSSKKVTMISLEDISKVTSVSSTTPPANPSQATSPNNQNTSTVVQNSPNIIDPSTIAAKVGTTVQANVIDPAAIAQLVGQEHQNQQINSNQLSGETDQAVSLPSNISPLANSQNVIDPSTIAAQVGTTTIITETAQQAEVQSSTPAVVSPANSQNVIDPSTIAAQVGTTTIIAETTPPVEVESPKYTIPTVSATPNSPPVKAISAEDVKKESVKQEKSKEEQKKERKALKKSLKNKRKKEKSSFINFSLILSICLLLVVIIAPPTLRKLMPKVIPIIPSDSTNTVILSCSAINNTEDYIINSRAKYTEDKLVQNIITYTKANDKGVFSETTVSASKDIETFKKITGVVITEKSPNTTIVTIYDYIAEKNTSNDILMNHFKAKQNQKDYYTNMGFTCEELTS